MRKQRERKRESVQRRIKGQSGCFSRARLRDGKTDWNAVRSGNNVKARLDTVLLNVRLCTARSLART